MGSQPPTENKAKGAENESPDGLSTKTEAGSLGLFRELTRKIFAVTPTELREAAEREPNHYERDDQHGEIGQAGLFVVGGHGTPPMIRFSEKVWRSCSMSSLWKTMASSVRRER